MLIEQLWNLTTEHSYHDFLIRHSTAPWQALDEITRFIQRVGSRENNHKKDQALTLIIHPTALVHPTAILEGGTIIDAHCKIGRYAIVDKSYVAPNTVIGDHTLVRNSLIAAHCSIGHGTEVGRSILLHAAAASHKCTILDSIIGQNVNLGGLFTSANTRLDEMSISIKIAQNGTRFTSGMTRLGILVGDNAKIGAYCLTMPGTILGKNSRIYPGAMLHGYYPPGSEVKVRQQTENLLQSAKMR